MHFGSDVCNENTIMTHGFPVRFHISKNSQKLVHEILHSIDGITLSLSLVSLLLTQNVAKFKKPY